MRADAMFWHNDAVRNVIAIEPGYRGADCHGQRYRRELEIVDHDPRVSIGGGEAADHDDQPHPEHAEQRPVPGKIARPSLPKHRTLLHAASGVSTMASGVFADTRLTLAMPRYCFSSPAGTNIGPGLFAVPGA